MKNFSSHGVEYVIDDLGVINQLDPKPFKYDAEYVSCYDHPDYQRQSDLLQALRLGFVIGAYGATPFSLLDYGCGNGAFLKFAAAAVHRVSGYDISGVELDGIKTYKNHDWLMTQSLDAVTFWDVLEHLHDLSFLRHLQANLVVVSLPYCHFHTQGQEWFDTKYIHRKPNEHVRHFNPHSLTQLMKHHGWHKVASSNHEDLVRKSTHGLQNILSMAFKH